MSCLPTIRKNSNLGKQLGLSKDTRYNTITEIRELINQNRLQNVSNQSTEVVKEENNLEDPFKC